MIKLYFRNFKRVKYAILLSCFILGGVFYSLAFCDSYSNVIDFFRTTFSFYNQVEEGEVSPYILWTPDDRISEVNNITKDSTSYGLIFTGYDQDNNKIVTEFKKTGRNEGILELYYKGVKQLSCSEYFTEEHKCFLNISCPIEPDHYLKILIADPNPNITYSGEKQYQIKIETMGEVFEGEIATNMESLPILNEIEAYRQELSPSPIKIAALNHQFLNYIVQEIEGEGIVLGIWSHILNLIVAAGTDFVGGIGTTIVAHIVSELICPELLY